MVKSGGLTVVRVLVGLLLGSAVHAMSTQQRLDDFQQMVSIIQRNYGPLHWKKETIQLDFPRLVETYRAQAQAAKSDAEFYRILALFLSELKDAHVGAMVPSTYRARLGFLCDLVEGKVLIETIDRLRLPENFFPFRKGDQLLAIDGVDVQSLMADLSRVGNTGHAPSANRFAAARLTSRSQAGGLQVPRGVTNVTVLPKGAAQPITVNLTWMVSGTPLIELDDLSGLLESTAAVNALPTAGNGQELRESLERFEMFQLALPKAVVEEMQRAGVTDIGNPKSMFNLPANAKPLPGIPLTAAIYEAGGKKIGILRLPSYVDKGLLEVVARVVYTFEQATDVMVIDQTNNPGGSVALVSDIVSLFANKSFRDMNFELRASMNWLMSFQSINKEIADALAANPADPEANALKARFEYLEWETADALTRRRFATAPVSLNLLGAFGQIQPVPGVNYSKPVLLLINEFDFSGGDAFPALMKDNGRAVLFGAQTSGAGGNVKEYGPLANSAFRFSLTESLMIRPNGEYMENRGVVPDIAYQMTEDDFMNGYRNYVRAFTIEALKLVGVSQAEFEASESAPAAK